jgi:hypothetical protein
MRQPRPRIAFRTVNRPDRPGYDPQMQRHHLLPQQIMTCRPLRRMVESLDRRRLGFDDFRINGMLLPAREESALATSLPLHRGPHRHYNTVVMERVGQIERDWSTHRSTHALSAAEDALMRLALLQSALRRRLLATLGKRLLLNRRDPCGGSVDFSELDAMADALWGATVVLGDPFSDALVASAQPAAAFAALSTARTLAVATSGWMPTPQTTEPSGLVHST